ncbi:MAG: SIR2 family protein [Deltaproteobacteria bacterium]|nr:SIR2 family protein [Deltaproteobacteria bacterium]
MMSDLILAYDAFLRSVKQSLDNEHIFLLGAGASISSGVKPAEDCIWEWKKDIFISKNPNLSSQYREYKTEAVRYSIQKWLDNEGCYPALNDPYEYSKYAVIAYPIDDIRKKYFENICRSKEPYIGYRLLCLLAQFGMIHSVFTTNFDGLLIKAAHQTNLTPIDITLDAVERIHRPASRNELLCVALHGDFKYGPLKNTNIELDTQDDTFVEVLTHHLYNKHLIVSGYSGRDRSLMKALKTAYTKKGPGLLFWCGYGHEIKPEVEELLFKARENGRHAFFVPTDGFDNMLIHLARNCFENNPEFKAKIEQTLKTVSSDAGEIVPFSMEVKHTNTIIRSNLFPLSFPAEVFQFELEFSENEKPWQTIKDLTKNSDIVAVPLKRLVYALGSLSDIHNVFSSRIKCKISRTPISMEELKHGSVIKNLYRNAVINGICKERNLINDGYARVWQLSDKKTIDIGNETFEIFEAAKISLFFDHKYVYISLKPSFELTNQEKVSKTTKKEIARIYYEGLFKRQPNPNFDAFLNKWRSIFFPDGNRWYFDYPPKSASGLRFSISSDTMHVNLMKAGTEYGLRYLPKSFNQKTLVHNGIQYLEPKLDFIHKNTGRITKDFHPMRGLVNNQPYDFPMNGNVFDGEINLGVICPLSYSDKLFQFLNRLNQQASAGAYNPDYLLDYPSFLSVYGIPLNIPHVKSECWQDCNLADHLKDEKETALNLLATIKNRIDRLETFNKKLVVVIFIPTLWDAFTKIDDMQERFDLHDQIKAYAAQRGVATQLIREDTLRDPLICQVNWWLSLAFYVKALRTPWLLTGLDTKTAFVGIGYSVNRKMDREKVVLGCSHIYNANGQGLKYRLSRVEDCYIDRKNNPYLSYQDAYKFGIFIRELFFNAMGDLPSRVVVHKRTHFKKDEINGITDSLKKSGIEQIDLIEINFEEDARFISLALRDGQFQPHPFPLSRGTCFLLDTTSALLWTHGIVPSVKADNRNYYLGGKNLPEPLKIRKHYGESNISTIATEILGLTKMNWNSFDMYSKLPATIQTSNEIARVGWLLSRFEGKTYDYRNFI